jgi:adenosylcobinamide kinase/adenosylcobinamide-phosphate guanylyltransferase
MIQFFLGGARSGKSSLAEQAAKNSQLDVVYIATGQALDQEMQQRIARHQDDRPSHWLTVEEPLNLATVLQEHASEKRCLLVDCLTLWLSNQLLQQDDLQGNQQYQQQKAELLHVLAELPGQIILVSNEVGQGIVPLGELSRHYVDEAGWLHQAIAKIADQVRFVCAGIAVNVKG